MQILWIHTVQCTYSYSVQGTDGIPKPWYSYLWFQCLESRLVPSRLSRPSLASCSMDMALADTSATYLQGDEGLHLVKLILPTPPPPPPQPTLVVTRCEKPAVHQGEAVSRILTRTRMTKKNISKQNIVTDKEKCSQKGADKIGQFYNITTMHMKKGFEAFLH